MFVQVIEYRSFLFCPEYFLLTHCWLFLVIFRRVICRIRTSRHADYWWFSDLKTVLEWVVCQVHCLKATWPEWVLFFLLVYSWWALKVLVVSKNLGFARFRVSLYVFGRGFIVGFWIYWLCRGLLKIWTKFVFELLCFVVFIWRWALLILRRLFPLICRRTFIRISSRGSTFRYRSVLLLL